MNLPTLNAKGVSTSGRVKHAALARRRAARRLDNQTRYRLRRGFVSLRELDMSLEGEL